MLDTLTPAEYEARARAAVLNHAERCAALERTLARRAELLAELATIEAIAAGHRAALAQEEAR